jgi:hypothetical protein
MSCQPWTVEGEAGVLGGGGVLLWLSAVPTHPCPHPIAKRPAAERQRVTSCSSMKHDIRISGGQEIDVHLQQLNVRHRRTHDTGVHGISQGNIYFGGCTARGSQLTWFNQTAMALCGPAAWEGGAGGR